MCQSRVLSVVLGICKTAHNAKIWNNNGHPGRWGWQGRD